MALTITNPKMQVMGITKCVSGIVTFDSSYLTGGELFPPSMLGLYALTFVDLQPAGLDATHAFLPAWNQLQGALSALKLFWGDNANAGVAQLIEVASTTNCAAAAFQFQATGY